jgi:HAE1 family hydrophobic/amphiphilic exporter-1
MIAILTPQNERERSAQQLIIDARAALGNIPGTSVAIFDPSGMFTGGDRGELQFYIRGNIELDELDQLADRFQRELLERPGFVDLNKSLKVGLPEVRVVPDREKAAALGVDARSISTVIQAAIGGMDIGTFKEGGHRFDIRMRLEAEERATPSSIQRLFVRAKDGSTVELRNLVKIETGAAPATISRHDRQRSVSISGNLEGITIDDAIAEIRAIGDEILPEGVNVTMGGSAEAFLEGVRQFGVAILLSILVIYMVLAAQFESLLHPFTVMLALPLAMVGALSALGLLGMTLNLFSLIGIILLMGLVTKNSILLVDFANQLRAEGMDKVAAMTTAAPIRMRPVLMTAISMIFGVLPAAIGVGPGAESRQPMAVATAAGMFSSTALTLLVVPVFYLVLDDATDWLRGLLRRARRGPSSKELPRVAGGGS